MGKSRYPLSIPRPDSRYPLPAGAAELNEEIWKGWLDQLDNHGHSHDIRYMLRENRLDFQSGFNRLFGDGRDGDVVISGSTDLGSVLVKQYKNLTIQTGASLTCDGPYLYMAVKDTLRIQGTGVINMNQKGGVGGAGGVASGGGGQAGDGRLYFINTAPTNGQANPTYGGGGGGGSGPLRGGNGGVPVGLGLTVGSGGYNYGSYNLLLAAGGGGGGSAGSDTYGGQNGSSGISYNNGNINELYVYDFQRWNIFKAICGKGYIPGWGGGGGGGGGGNFAGGDGGDGGGGVYIEARNIILPSSGIAISCNGQSGGAGTAGTGSDSGGGGGGGAGCAFLVCYTGSNLSTDRISITRGGGGSGGGLRGGDGGVGNYGASVIVRMIDIY